MPGNVSCSGKITATFTWDNKGNAADLPPKSVVITETATTSAGGFYRSVSGSVDTGIGESGNATPVPYQGPYTGLFTADVTKSKIRYTVKTVTSPLTLDCTPTATGTGSDLARASVSYSASATPVKINLEGVTTDGSSLKVLTGQQVRASLSLATAQSQTAIMAIVPGSHQWNVSGALPFKRYVTGDDPETPVVETMGKKFDLEGSDKNKDSLLFFTSEDNEVTITCNATVQLPDGNKPVTAEAILRSIKPTVSKWLVKSATPRFDLSPPLGPTFIPGEFFPKFLGDDTKPAHEGQDWEAKVNTVTPFVNNGVAAFAQLITPDRYLVEKGGRVLHPKNYPDGTAVNGTAALDKQFPSFIWSVDIEGKFGDSPGQPIGDTVDELCKESKGGDSATTWIMYQPFAKDGLATCWVPLQKCSWNWGATATQTKVGDEWQSIWNLGSLIGASRTSEPSNTSDFPDWKVVQPGGATEFVP